MKQLLMLSLLLIGVLCDRDENVQRSCYIGNMKMGLVLPSMIFKDNDELVYRNSIFPTGITMIHPHILDAPLNTLKGYLRTLCKGISHKELEHMVNQFALLRELIKHGGKTPTHDVDWEDSVSLFYDHDLPAFYAEPSQESGEWSHSLLISTKRKPKIITEVIPAISAALSIYESTEREKSLSKLKELHEHQKTKLFHRHPRSVTEFAVPATIMTTTYAVAKIYPEYYLGPLIDPVETYQTMPTITKSVLDGLYRLRY